MALRASRAKAGSARRDAGVALAVEAKARNIMEVYRMLACPSEDITWKTAEMMGIAATGQWGSCETCFQVKTKRCAVQKMTNERISVKVQRFVADVDKPMKYWSPGADNYVIVFVDDFTNLKAVKAVKKMSDTMAALLSLVEDYITHRSYRSRAHGRMTVESLRERFSANCTSAALHTNIRRRTRRSTTGWSN